MSILNLSRRIAGLIFMMPVFTLALFTIKAVQAKDIPLVINIYDAVVTYPSPSWIPQGADTDQIMNGSEFFREQKGEVFVFEQIPKGQEFDSWTSIYAVSGLKVPTDSPVTMDLFVSSTLSGLANACDGRDNIFLHYLEKTEKAVTTLIFCQKFGKGPHPNGYHSSMGEIGLFRFFRKKDTFIKVYQEWRGNGFIANNPDSWPMPKTELDQMVKRFQTIKIN